MGNIPWHRHTTICWSFHQWIDTWVASNLGQLWRLYAYKFLGRHIFLLFIGKYLKVRLLGHMVDLCLPLKTLKGRIFEKSNCIFFSNTFYLSTYYVQGKPRAFPQTPGDVPALCLCYLISRKADLPYISLSLGQELWYRPGTAVDPKGVEQMHNNLKDGKSLWDSGPTELQGDARRYRTEKSLMVWVASSR